MSSSTREKSLSWFNVSYAIPLPKPKSKKGKDGSTLPAPPSEKKLLTGMTGQVNPGEVVAIMGGSGAGKTTLLNVLAGRIGAGTLSGDILVNGHRRSRRSWRKVAGYVEQDDILFKNLTVKETLTYAAKLRLPSNITLSEKEIKVDKLISELGLRNCQDTRIGDASNRGVSGGERKRVSIGVELITEPDILFLDEPTSGLDAFTAVNIISTVSNLAKNPARKTTVMLTIHQPRTDILEMFDKIVILAAGRTVFFGTLNEALTFFAKLEYPLPDKTNPSDHFIDIATLDQRSPELQASSLERINKFVSAWDVDKSKLSGLVATPYRGDTVMSKSEFAEGDDDAKYNSSWFTQFYVLLGRNLKDAMRDPAVIGASIIQNIIVCLFVGFIFFRVSLNQSGIQNRIGAAFFLAVNQTFGQVMPTLALLPLQTIIIRRERSAGTYSASAAYFAKLTSTLPLTIVGTLILGVPVYWMIGFQSVFSKFITFIVIILVHSITAMTLGLMIGSGVKDVQIGQIVGPLIIVLFLVFGGQFVNLDSIPTFLRWIKWLSIIAYTNKAISQNELNGLKFNCDVQPCFANGTQVLNTYSLTAPDGVWSCVGINAGFAVFFSFVGYLLFKRTSKPLLRLH